MIPVFISLQSLALIIDLSPMNKEKFQHFDFCFAFI